MLYDIARHPGGIFVKRALPLAALLLLAACAGSSPKVADPASQTINTGGLELPATFAGDLPCADCPGIRYQLDLWSDGAFHLRQEYLDRNTVRVDRGHWRVDPARRALILQSAKDVVEFEIRSPSRLRMLDRDGNPVESKLNYELTKQSTFAPAG